MTLDECCAHIGDGVVYRPGMETPYGPPEDGVITSTNAAFAFVRFNALGSSKACRPADLTLLSPGTTS